MIVLVRRSFTLKPFGRNSIQTLLSSRSYLIEIKFFSNCDIHNNFFSLRAYDEIDRKELPDKVIWMVKLLPSMIEDSTVYGLTFCNI